MSDRQPPESTAPLHPTRNSASGAWQRLGAWVLRVGRRRMVGHGIVGGAWIFDDPRRPVSRCTTGASVGPGCTAQARDGDEW